MSVSGDSWINWFVGLKANEFLCRVPDEFARDRFNLTGLDTLVPNYYDTLDAIFDTEFDTKYGFEVNNSFIDSENVKQLYGLIHARYIVTQRGIADMSFKYKRGDFGVCPRIHCDGQLVLPVGLTARIGKSHVKVYCARCRDIYQPNDQCALLDGAMFGCSFPHIFYMQLPKLLPKPPTEKYYPSIYGFKVHTSALLPPSAQSTTSKESCNKTAP